MERRHRTFTIPSGALLFVCMFLPAVKSCGNPVYPVELPPVWPPYLVGLVLALAAIFHTPRAYRAALLATRVMAVAMLGLAIVMFGPAWWIMITLGFAAAFWWALGYRSGVTSPEYRIARGALVFAIAFIAWFSLFCFDPGGGQLIGIWVSLLTSLGLLVGALFWMAEAPDPRG